MLVSHLYRTVHMNRNRLTLNLSVLDSIADILRTPSIHLATSAEGGTQNLLDGPLEVLGQRLKPHRPCDRDDLIERNRLGVLDVLLLLTVTRGLLEGLDDEGRGRGNNGDSGLTVLDGQADCDAQTFLEKQIYQ